MAESLTKVSLGGTGRFLSVVNDGLDNFYAVVTEGTGVSLYKSIDSCQTWSYVFGSAEAGFVPSVLSGAVLVDSSGKYWFYADNNVYSSVDGESFSLEAASIGVNVRAGVFFNNLFIIWGGATDGSQYIQTSSDGKVFTSRLSAADFDNFGSSSIDSVQFFIAQNGLYCFPRGSSVSYRDDQTPPSYFSSNGISWSDSPSITSSVSNAHNYRDMAIVGENRYMMYFQLWSNTPERFRIYKRDGVDWVLLSEEFVSSSTALGVLSLWDSSTGELRGFETNPDKAQLITISSSGTVVLDDVNVNGTGVGSSYVSWYSFFDKQIVALPERDDQSIFLYQDDSFIVVPGVPPVVESTFQSGRTIGEMLTKVRLESGDIDADEFTDSQLITFVNQAVDFVSRELVGLGDAFFIVEGNVSDGQAIPAGFIKLAGAQRVYVENGEFRVFSGDRAMVRYFQRPKLASSESDQFPLPSIFFDIVANVAVRYSLVSLGANVTDEDSFISAIRGQLGALSG